jgi:hypothetical protein
MMASADIVTAATGIDQEVVPLVDKGITVGGTAIVDASDRH